MSPWGNILHDSNKNMANKKSVTNLQKKKELGQSNFFLTKNNKEETYITYSFVLWRV